MKNLSAFMIFRRAYFIIMCVLHVHVERGGERFEGGARVEV
jgi:hypothetical protein